MSASLLDDLLAESVAQADQAKLATAARARLKSQSGSAAERAEDAARIARWEAEREWDQKANVALFHDFACSCGETRTSVFQGLFIRETHKELGHGSQRWRRVEAATAGLPNEVAVRCMEVPICMDCAEGKGWMVENVTEWEG